MIAEQAHVAPHLKRDIPEPPWLMPLLDASLAFLAFGLAYVLRYQFELIRPVLEVNRVPFRPYVPFALVYVTWLMVNYAGGGLYRRWRGRSFFDEFATIANGVTNATVLVMAISFVLQATVFSRLMLVYVAAITILLLGSARIARRMTYAYLRTQKRMGTQRVLIIGFGEVGQAVLRTMMARKGLGYLPIGYLDDVPERGNTDLGRLRGLGGLNNLAEALEDHYVDLVVITLSWIHHERIMEMVQTCTDAGVDVRMVPDVFQLNLRQVNIENLDGIPLLGVSTQPQLKGGNRLLKRIVDLTLVMITAPLWLLVVGLVALAIRLDDNGPVFYTQRRVGEGGRLFDMVKFRSMVPDADRYREQLVREHNLDPRHPKIENDPRITRVGQFIRRTSLDELPNIFNVLRGQMSLVGPRPPTPDEVALYESWHRQRLFTMPGITGLWQVSGRSDIPFDEMVLLDIYYIENWSPRLDAEILLRTVPRVLLRDGAY